VVGHTGAGIFAGNEIQASGDPRQHAINTVNNMIANNFKWLAVEASSNDAFTMSLTREACQITGGKVKFGIWDQNLAPDVFNKCCRDNAAEFAIVNVESPEEDAKWTTTYLDALVALGLPGGLAVIYTEGAWGRDSNKTLKYRLRNFFSIPEAIESENYQAEIDDMMFLSSQLGWVDIDCGPSVYINKNYPSSEYTDQIALTKGRFSVYRLGDIDATDWAEFAKWPRVTTYTPPAPPPTPPSPPPVNTTAIMLQIAQLCKQIEAGFKPGTGDLSRARLIRRAAESTDSEWYQAREPIKKALDASGA